MTNSKLRMFVPIAKVDVEAREVWGRAAEEAPDRARPIPEMMDYQKSRPHFEGWSDSFAKATAGTGQEPSLGNLRAMHGKVAAGKVIAIDLNDDDRAVDVGCKVVDDNEWEKVLSGTYTGFSIGGSYGESEIVKLDDGRDCKKYEALPTELSLADSPCMPGAVFSVVKSDGTRELRKAQRVVAAEKALGPDAAALANLAIICNERELLSKQDGGPAAGASDAANNALEWLKNAVSQFAMIDGEPDTWALDDMIVAMNRILAAKWSLDHEAAEEKAEAMDALDSAVIADQQTDDGPGDPLEMSVKAQLKKLADQVGGMQELATLLAKQEDGEETDDPPAPPSDEEDEEDEDGDGDGTEEEEDDTAEKTDTAALQKTLGDLVAVNTDMAKAVSAALKAAGPDGDLEKQIKKLEATVAKISKAPRAVGRAPQPVDKTLGGDAGTGDGVSVDGLRKTVDELANKGQLTAAGEVALRSQLAELAVPRAGG